MALDDGNNMTTTMIDICMRKPPKEIVLQMESLTSVEINCCESFAGVARQQPTKWQQHTQQGTITNVNTGGIGLV